jgi:alcohol dehydrogenase class IV
LDLKIKGSSDKVPDRYPGFVQRTALRVGPGAITELPESAAALGMTRPAVVIDQALLATPVGDTIRRLLPAATIVAHPTAEPSVQSVLHVVAELGAGDADGIIAVGGGSSLDTGKVSRALLAAKIDRWQDLPEPIPPGLPLIAVPTTAGTGAEAGSGALLYDPEINDKVLVRRLGMAADLAIADGDLTLSLPARLTAYTGLDALAQAILAYVPAMGSSISGQVALRAIRLIFRALPKAVTNGCDRSARTEMMLGSVMSALAMFNAPPTYAAEHTFAEAIGPAAGINHGHAVAGFLVPLAEYNLEPLADHYAEIAAELGLASESTVVSEAADAFLDGLEALVRRLGVEPLASVAKAWDRDDLAARCRRHDGFSLNPRPIDDAAVHRILDCAYSGSFRL